MLHKEELVKFNKALNGKKYDRLPILFDALSEPTRCRIVRLLIKKEDHKLAVGDIAAIIGISPSLASQHIKILEITGIVQKNKSGKTKYIEINIDDPVIQALIKAIE